VNCRFGPTNDPEKYRLVEGDGLYKGTSKCTLGPTALKVLVYLLEHPDVMKTPEMIAAHIHGKHWHGNAEYFAYTYVSQIRRALEKRDDAITVERTLGYKFNWKVLDDAPPSVAVLPFKIRGNQSDEDFADGLTDDLTDTLMRCRSLSVGAHASARQFEDDANRDYHSIGKELGVEFLAEGTIEQSGKHVRVFAKLIRARNGAVFWRDKYDRELNDVKDIFAVRDEIATAIAQALHVKLGRSKNSVPEYVPNTEAREAFSKGRHQFYKYRKDRSALAEEHFKDATRLDPQWAPPHSFLAYELFNSGILGWRSLAEIEPIARAEAQAALTLDDSEPIAHMVLGAIAALQEYDWKKAEDHFLSAIAAESLPPEVHVGYSQYFLMPLGRFEEAVQQCEAAVKKDRLNALWRTRLAGALLCAGLYDDAIAEARNALAYDSKNYSAHYLIAMSYAFRGMEAEARESAEKAVELGSQHDGTLGLLAGILANTGELESARQIYENFRPNYHEGRIMYHLMRAEIDDVLDWYEENIKLHSPGAAILAAAGFHKRTRSSPRWPRLARMMNLPQPV
jgi:TolB-like protein/Tfp pilus assembly protein PilF